MATMATTATTATMATQWPGVNRCTHGHPVARGQCMATTATGYPMGQGYPMGTIDPLGHGYPMGHGFNGHRLTRKSLTQWVNWAF